MSKHVWIIKRGDYLWIKIIRQLKYLNMMFRCGWWRCWIFFAWPFPLPAAGMDIMQERQRIPLADAKICWWLACLWWCISFLPDDYSGALWATCPDFESHYSGKWEPVKISDFGWLIIFVRTVLVKAANTPLKRLRPWQVLSCQISNNQAKS